MSGLPDLLDVERFRSVVAERLGLQFDDTKLELLSDVLGRRLAERREEAGEYLQRLADPVSGTREIAAVAQHLTVGETYFFRNPNDLAAFVEVVLPARIRANASRRQLRILSAGCASGEEPYSLAMLVLEHLPDVASWDIAIRGIDVNAEAIRKASEARYSSWSLRQTPAEMQARFFRADGRDHRLADAVRRMVSFEHRNLVDDDRLFWQPEAFDVVFCRNVTMYFSQETTRRVVARIARSLAPGGFLFLGHAETLRGISTEFHLRHTHGTFYYQVRGGTDGQHAPVPAIRAGSRVAVPEVLDATASWVDAIQRASERIEKLARDPRARLAPERAAVAEASHRGEMLRAIELLRQERFAEAIDALSELPPQAQTDPDVLLLRAVLLTNSGDPRQAETVCSRILQLDELSAEAHYVAALCREHAGDVSGASDHDRSAAYLDPAFAMPRLHLGLMAKRAGDRDGARRELGRALVLLAGEEASRILLLGGGFSREALVQLCRAELRACGDVS